MDNHALRFCLDEIILSRRFDQLAELLTAGSSTSGLQGDPGWLLERLDRKGARPAYRAVLAFVPDECVVDEVEFARLAKAMIDGFLEVNGKKVEVRRALAEWRAKLTPILAELTRMSAEPG